MKRMIQRLQVLQKIETIMLQTDFCIRDKKIIDNGLI